MLYLARHGSTLLNEPPERLRGWQDLPLDKAGREESQELADNVKDLPIGLIWTSDLKRAVETAHMISEANKVSKTHPPVQPTSALRPWDLGKYGGVTVSQAIPELEKYVKTPSLKIPEGESAMEFGNRFLPFFVKLLKSAKRNDLMAVTHTRDIRLGLEYLKHPDRVDFQALAAKKDPVEPGDFLVLAWTGSRWHITPGDSLAKSIPGGA